MKHARIASALAAGLMGLSLCATTALASSHREAPFITEIPKLDGTDFYMFRSYEPGREDFVTLVANYQPLQDAYGGPNYFALDPDAVYEIHIDNNGDAEEDLTFSFSINRIVNDVAVPAGDRMTEIPLINAGQIGVNGDPEDLAAANVLETYTVDLIRGRSDKKRNRKKADPLTNVGTGSTTFRRPFDYIGTRSLPNYAAYANNHIFEVNVPDCFIDGAQARGRVFVGQRDDPFYISLGQVFDLINTGTIINSAEDTPDGRGVEGTDIVFFPPFSPNGQEENADIGQDTIADTNTTSFIVEMPIACLTDGDDPVIGAWTTASLPRARLLRNPSERRPEAAVERGRFVQVSRLGNPLFNELLIGVSTKDTYNNSHPADDEQFIDFVTNPSVPELIEILFGPNGAFAQVPFIQAPNFFPRADLQAIFLTGADIPGVLQNQPANLIQAGEMMRLNTAVPPTPIDQQSPLGVLGGDPAGYPNGRRPGDDSVDITVRAAMGAVLPVIGVDPDLAPAATVQFTDGAAGSALDFQNVFPYLNTPFPGDRVD